MIVGAIREYYAHTHTHTLIGFARKLKRQQAEEYNKNTQKKMRGCACKTYNKHSWNMAVGVAGWC